MTRALCIVTLFGAWLMYCGCSKPAHIHAGGRIDALAPLVQEVRLTDTISPAFAQALGLDAVTGTTFRYVSGMQSSYFSYVADADAVLLAVARLAFPLQDQSADVTYHEVSAEEWFAHRHIVTEWELMDEGAFWNVDPGSSEIYASAKNDHHLLIVDRERRQVFHRVSTRG